MHVFLDREQCRIKTFKRCSIIHWNVQAPNFENPTDQKKKEKRQL